MNVFKIIAFIFLASFFASCSDDSDRHAAYCKHPDIEVRVLMQNDPLCFDVHADIEITISDGSTEYVLLELLFERETRYGAPYSETMTFACAESLQVDFMCYSDRVWTRSEGSLSIPVSCFDNYHINIFADTINPLSHYTGYDGYVAFELENDFKCTEVESLYIAWENTTD